MGKVMKSTELKKLMGSQLIT